MILSSRPHVVKAINKRTKAVLFKDVEVGDMLQLHINMKIIGRGQGLYATYVTVENSTKGVYDSSKSQTEVVKILEYFELEEVK